MNTRYKKVIGDLKADYAKHFMLILAIAVGVFGIGSILGSYEVINREMAANYMSTIPASATLEVEEGISQELLDSVRKFPGIKEAERRATITARMQINERWYPILLFVMDDFDQLKISRFRHLSGETNPPEGTMLMERTALSFINAKEGDQITIRTPNGLAQSVIVSGTVHDPGLAPARQEQAGYAYISLATLHRLGEAQGFDLLRVAVSEDEYSVDNITKKAEALAGYLKESGYEIHEIQIPPPGRHPHQSQMNTILTIFTIFSFMILVLGSILVGTSMATLMMKQVRQIGVMKTIGGTSMQIAGMYLLMMVILCIIALIISIPLSRLAAFGFYSQIATLLNLEINNHTIPYSVPFIQIVAGICIPLLAAAVPLIRGSRITVRHALDNYGVSTKDQSNSIISRILSRMDFLSDTFRLSLRNAFRQQSRLVLTLGLLAAGGAMFMMALNVSDAWDKNLKRIYVQRLYDQEIKLNERINVDSLLDQIKSIHGLKTAEGWDYAPTSLVKKSGYEVTRTYPDKGHGSFGITALPVSSKLINPTIKEGRWLSTEGSNDVVLNQLARTPEMNIGDQISLGIDGKPTQWKIVGFVEDVGSPATAYVSLSAFSKLVNADSRVKMLRVSYNDRSRESAMDKNRQLDELLEKEKISVSSSTPIWLLHNAVAAHMKVLVNSLLAMAILMAFVGTLGLMSTISMNVLERTREIGVMRALGATPNKIRNLIVWEGLSIGALSIVVAFLISLILSYYMSGFIGHISFRTPLTLTVSILAIVIWVAIIIIGSYIATIYPARRANKITTREALAYE